MTKKYLLYSLLGCLVPIIAQADVWDAKIAELTKLKQNRMAEYDNCAGENKSLKIAGISLLGITAVGVASNVAEAVVLKKYDNKVQEANAQLDAVNASIERQKAENLAKEQKLAEQHLDDKQYLTVLNKTTIRQVAEEDIANINGLNGNIGDVVYSRGYHPEELPLDLKKRFADAVVIFLKKCKTNNESKNGIKSVKAEPDGFSIENNGTTKPDDYEVDVTDAKVYAKCEIDKCIEKTHVLENGQCVEKNKQGDAQSNDSNKDTPKASTPEKGDSKASAPKKDDAKASTPKKDDAKASAPKKDDAKASSQKKVCGNGYSLDSTGNTCVCALPRKEYGGVCGNVQQIDSFNNDTYGRVQCNFYQAQKLAKFYIHEQKGTSYNNINCVNGGTVRNDDFIKCTDKENADIYNFFFDDISESDKLTRATSLLQALCKLEGGRYTSYKMVGSCFMNGGDKTGAEKICNDFAYLAEGDASGRSIEETSPGVFKCKAYRTDGFGNPY